MVSPTWNTGSQRGFYDYYEKESAGQAALERFASIQRTVLRALGAPEAPLYVADIGCGAGTQSRLWAEGGHEVFGADINAALIALARERSADAGLQIGFAVASATDLPWPDASMDLCIAPELLEHVEDWQACLREMVRVLRPGGSLYISTSNVLCPRQEEFQLPLYSWYPPALKRHIVQLAMTSRPELAGYATYPAVNWFSYYGLRDWLTARGVRCQDRFDLIDVNKLGRARRTVISAVRAWPGLRWLAHVATPYTVVLGTRPRS